jgi:hypothetical protein
VTVVAAALHCGCTGAPSITVAGAYFPAWLACALVGVVAALATRAVLSACGVLPGLPLPLLVCGAAGVACAALAWAAWMGL